MKIDNLNNLIVGFCFIRSIDMKAHDEPMMHRTPSAVMIKK
jgi:hypothetical protein